MGLTVLGQGVSSVTNPSRNSGVVVLPPEREQQANKLLSRNQLLSNAHDVSLVHAAFLVISPTVTESILPLTLSCDSTPDDVILLLPVTGGLLPSCQCSVYLLKSSLYLNEVSRKRK